MKGRKSGCRVRVRTRDDTSFWHGRFNQFTLTFADFSSLRRVEKRCQAGYVQAVTGRMYPVTTNSSWLFLMPQSPPMPNIPNIKLLLDGQPLLPLTPALVPDQNIAQVLSNEFGNSSRE